MWTRCNGILKSPQIRPHSNSNYLSEVASNQFQWHKHGGRAQNILNQVTSTKLNLDDPGTTEWTKWTWQCLVERPAVSQKLFRNVKPRLARSALRWVSSFCAIWYVFESFLTKPRDQLVIYSNINRAFLWMWTKNRFLYGGKDPPLG